MALQQSAFRVEARAHGVALAMSKSAARQSRAADADAVTDSRSRRHLLLAKR